MTVRRGYDVSRRSRCDAAEQDSDEDNENVVDVEKDQKRMRRCQVVEQPLVERFEKTEVGDRRLASNNLHERYY